MAKKNDPIIVPPAKPRNPFALHAKRRRAAKFKDKREPRGGNKNIQKDLLDEDT